MVDNGYDISDYRAINPIFGTMANMSREAVHLPLSYLPEVERPDILTGRQVATQVGTKLDPYEAFAVWT